jgi:VanZ family protein
MNSPLFSWVRILGRIAAPAILVAIWVLSLLPGETVAQTGWIAIMGDKAAHALAYAAFACSMICAMAKDDMQTSFKEIVQVHRYRILIVIGTVIVLGSGAEVIQPLFSRGFEFLDIVADTLGGLVGIVLGLSVITAVRLVERRS